MSAGTMFIALLIIGILALFVTAAIQYWRNRWLMKHGRVVVATVDSIEVVAHHHGDYTTHYRRIAARWQDPETQQYYYYESDFPYNVPMRTLHPQKSQVNIYIDPQNTDRYLMAP